MKYNDNGTVKEIVVKSGDTLETDVQIIMEWKHY